KTKGCLIANFATVPTKAYVARRVAEEHTKMEAIYLTRSLFITAQSKQADQQHPDNGLLLEWRPGQPVRQRRLAALLPDQQPSTGHKPACQLSG
ncbi:hypothetical protein ACGLZE_004603, partial [Salmonella enterica subsp. enterica serovar Infantis]